jgi:hypothetical protein
MLKKRNLVILVFIFGIIYSIGYVSGANETGVDRAYECLEGLIEDKTTSTISLQEAIFSTLALGGEDVLKDKLSEEKSGAAECWPKDKCKVKETAQVGMAYERINKNTDDLIDWLYTKNGTTNELIWYLEIDISSHEAAECILRYDGLERTISIREDMTLDGSPGNCFVISGNDYFLEVRESCYQKDIEISCDKDFITTLLYTKKSGDTLYVLPETHSSAALGTTNEKVDVQCFKNDGKCDYEGSLWATLFLHKVGEKVDSFVPYLIALAEDNTEYFPESFLYSLTGSNDQYSNIIQKQKQGRIWKMISTPYNEYYDTSLAMLALSDSDIEPTKTYLLSIQSASGCWNNNNIRDTAFVLYSGWEKSVKGDVDVSGTPLCTTITSQSCEIHNDCIGAGGRVLANFECSGFDICCSVEVPERTCADQGGNLCSEDQECSGTASPSSDDSLCCLGTCEDKYTPPEIETCVEEGYFCSSSCFDDEEEVEGFTCNNDNICCKPSEKGGSAWLIILLIILIILVILAIVFRDKLIFYYYKIKGKASSKPVIKPGVPPSKTILQNTQAPINTPVNRPVMGPRTPPVQRNREFEDTLKKLRDMSK